MNIPTAILLIGYSHQDNEQIVNFQRLADRLAEHLAQVVIPCPLDREGDPVLDGIRDGLRQGAVKFVVLPLLLSPAEYRESAIAEAIQWASRRWSFLSFHISPPMDWWRWTDVMAAAIEGCADNLTETGVILAGLVPAGRDQDDAQAQAQTKAEIEAEADLAKLGWLLQASTGVPRVELALRQNDRTSLEDAVSHCQLVGVQQIVVMPAFLFGGKPYTMLQQAVAQIRSQSDIAIVLTPPLSEIPCDTSNEEPALITALSWLYEEALADDSLLSVSWDEVRRQVEASNAEHRPQPLVIGGEMPVDEAQFQDLTQRINAILPPRYRQENQGETAISAAPMASADLQFDEHGNVAWDQMWGLDDPDNPFCELALAGGPPHRGDLLEPVAADACEANPGKYAAVLAELARGIELVAGLSTVHAKSAGWIGVQCESPEMAIWLLRAIIVENVMVRREEDVLYLPTGPDFTLAAEIKNVVTVVAKTVHYWQEHSQFKVNP